MRRKKSKGRGLHPAAAVLMLCASVGVAFFSLRGQFGGAGGDGGGAGSASAAIELEPEGGEARGDEGAPGRDLLAEHGSWEPATPVRMAFVSPSDAAIQAAPLAETIVPGGARWVGADPPALHVGVLMVGETARRAVVDGVVVGVGDKVGAALVAAIERDAVLVTWAGRRLTYDLENEHPREFRGELARRAAGSGAAPAPGEAKKKQEEGQ